MSQERWALIDARGGTAEISPASPVAGVPLVARLARQAARLGLRRVVIACGSDARRAEVHAALGRRPPPKALAVELLDGDPPPGAAITLDGTSVYLADALRAALAAGAAPEPLFVVRTRAEARAAVGRLFLALRKNVDHDGEFAFYIIRPVARLLTRALLPTPVSPNHVTVAAILCGLAAAALAAVGGRGPVALAGALFIVGVFIDCADGELARLRVEGSRAGEWLDTLGDDVATCSLITGIGVGLVRDGAHPAWQLVAAATAVTGAAVAVRLYLDLHRMGLPIDTAVYPWFFRKEEAARALKKEAAPAPAARGGPGAAVGKALNFLFRRDVYATIVGVLLVADQRQVAVALLMAGILGLAGMYVVHAAVTAAQTRARR
jgi:phosphatidylglycerophosphate synthase